MKILSWISLIAVMSCTQKGKTFEDIDLQGHRGARGLMPENTIPGFLHAIDLGVNTLELDLVITADSQVLVSHEPFMNAEIAIDSTGYRFPDEDRLKHNIYNMTYEEVSKFDVGLRMHPRFPEQRKIEATKPLLKIVFDSVENYIVINGFVPVNYNIEIKSRADADGLYQPEVPDFCQRVFSLIDSKLDWTRVTIQSFDDRVLRYFNENYPQVTLAYLVGDYPYSLPNTRYSGDSGVDANIEKLGFTPNIYSPDYHLLSKEIVIKIQKKGMKVIPWTVNERADMDRLLAWGVDGIITDYPNRTK